MLLRSTLIYAPAVLLTRISALLLLAIATRLIDQTEYGLLTLVVTIGEMTDVAVTNWLRISLLRLGGKGEISRGSVMLAARVLLATTALALCISVVASAVIVPERWIAFATAVSVYLIAGSIGRFGLTVLQMQQRHSTYSMLEFLRAGLQLALPIIAISFFEKSFLIVSLGTSLGTMIAGAFSVLIATRRLVAGPPRFTHRDLFALGLPLVIMALVGFGLSNAERIVLKVFHDAGAVAVFAAAYALARQPIDMLANAVNMGAFPEVVSRFDSDGPRAAALFLRQLMALMIRLCLPVAALLVALAGDITALVLPADYLGANIVQLFPVIALSVLAANISNFVYGSVVHAHKRPWLLIIADGLGSIATISLSLLLIPSMAGIGAALSLLGGSLTGLAGCIVISHRLTPVPIPMRDIGISLVIAIGCGLAAHLAAGAFAAFPVIVRLAAGGAAGGLVFLGLNALFHRQATLDMTGKLRGKLSRSGA